MSTEEFLNEESFISKLQKKQKSKSEFYTPINYFFVLTCYYSLKEKSKENNNG